MLLIRGGVGVAASLEEDRFLGFGDTSGFWPIEATRMGGLGLISGRPVVEVERTGGTGRT